MKRKLIQLKSISTLKSLHKNLTQGRDGATKDIEKANRKRNRIDADIYLVEEIITQKQETE
ncbi:MAG: hypothetical protein KJI69_05290 [Patescibacteria group bacterium]|nr:hypothetical protein [Patescibacteria group bacterium]